MKLDVKRQLFARTDRVKGIDFHPTEPWILCTLYSGHVNIWSYETQQVVKTFEINDVPIRAGRFIARKNWIVCGSDDFYIRVYNYNTGEKVASFEAHPDYIRSIAVHPTQPFVLTSSDDMTIKLWDWEKGWKCVQVYEGHVHYVMSIAINPKDTNTFATACLDRTVKVWSLGSPTPNFTLEAHDTKGVNYVEYYPHSDKPYLITTSDDRTVKVWDYTTKSLIATLEGHANNVSFACYHPELPIIISGSEDGTIRLWNANTYRFEQSLSYGLERAWCVASQKGKQGIAVGFDQGAVVIKLGRDEPAISMDASGKIVWARHNEAVSAMIKGSDETIQDNQPIVLSTKDLGTCEVHPQTLIHSPNGRFVAICGDGEYIIYTALAWRNKAFGSALDFVWGSKENSNDYAIRESPTSVKIFKNFQDKTGAIDIPFHAEGLAGGALLGVKGQGGVSFYDWQTGGLVRRIEVEPLHVYWSEGGDLVAIACEDAFYILRYSRDSFYAAVQAGEVEEDGVESAFEVVADINETVRTGEWVGEVFLYTNNNHRLSYLVGDQTHVVSHFDKDMYLLGYLQRDGRAYLVDKDINLTSFALPVPVLEYQTLVLRGDLDSASELLPTIPTDQMNKVARFLEGQGLKELALEVTTDADHKFELALALQKLDVALELAKNTDSEHKWKLIGDTALAGWDLTTATQCFEQAKDLSSLLLVYSSLGDREGLAKLADQALEAGSHNIAFNSRWLLGDVDGSLEILQKTGRWSEAVLLAQTYKPSAAPALVRGWKESLEATKKGRVARVLGVPGEDEDLFPQWDEYLKLESEGGKTEAGVEKAAVKSTGEKEEEDESEEDEEEEEEEESEEEEDEEEDDE